MKKIHVLNEYEFQNVMTLLRYAEGIKDSILQCSYAGARFLEQLEIVEKVFKEEEDE